MEILDAGRIPVAAQVSSLRKSTMSLLSSIKVGANPISQVQIDCLHDFIQILKDKIIDFLGCGNSCRCSATGAGACDEQNCDKRGSTNPNAAKNLSPYMNPPCLLKISSHFFQAEQEVLARMEVDVQAARLLTWKVGFFKSRPGRC